MEETEAGIDGGEAQGMEDERLLEWSWTGEVILYYIFFFAVFVVADPANLLLVFIRPVFYHCFALSIKVSPCCCSSCAFIKVFMCFSPSVKPNQADLDFQTF